MSPPSTSTVTGSSSVEAAGRSGHLRATGRLLGFVGWSAGSLAVLGVGTLLLFPAARLREGWRRRVLRAWARGVNRLLGIRLVLAGPAPRRPFFLVSNHLSYLDVVVYAAAAGTRFVAKQEVRCWPAIGFLAWAGGTIFIDRTQKRDAVRVVDRLGQAVAGGDGVVVFAEATSTAGQGVLPFRPALLDWAARTGHPVHYASLGYTTPAAGPPAHLAVCWWGDMTFGRHFYDLCRLPWIEARLEFGGTPIEDDDRKRLAERLHRAVAAQFTPVAME